MLLGCGELNLLLSCKIYCFTRLRAENKNNLQRCIFRWNWKFLWLVLLFPKNKNSIAIIRRFHFLLCSGIFSLNAISFEEKRETFDFSSFIHFYENYCEALRSTREWAEWEWRWSDHQTRIVKFHKQTFKHIHWPLAWKSTKFYQEISLQTDISSLR